MLKNWRKNICVRELHWHVQNANNVTTTLQKIRKHIRTEWKQRSIADSARPILHTKKQNNIGSWFLKGVQHGRFRKDR